MGLLDYFVDPYFLDEKAGRVVVFTGDRRRRGHLVRSESDERKIRSFLEMYYCAEFSIQIVSMLLTIWWTTELLPYASENLVAHLLKSGAIFLGIYSLVVALPYVFLRRTYKKGILSFISAQDEIEVSGQRPRKQKVLLAVVVIAFAILVFLVIILLIRTK
jgi:hypothetical protein